MSFFSSNVHTPKTSPVNGTVDLFKGVIEME